MIKKIARLLELWRISAHYRLDTLFKGYDLSPPLQWLVKLIRLHPAAKIKTEKHNPLKLKCALEEMGVLAIKLGQLLSTRRDLIPPEILEQLVLLQDNVKPFDVELAKQRVCNAFKTDLQTLFVQFDDEPLAAASIAQVHTARLHTGQEVVVKITRPYIRQQIIQDFDSLMWLADFLEARFDAVNAMHLSEIVQDYRSIILNELDLTLEAENTRRMRSYFEHSQMIYVPEVYLDSHDVMVAERITGVPVSDVETLERLSIDRKKLAEHGLTVFFTQVFRDNFFHADMHAGNVFVDTSGQYPARYIALDCAIMGELSKADQMTVGRMLLAVMNQQFDQLVDVIDQAGWLRANVDRDALTREMRRTVAPMIAKPMDQLDFAGILYKIMDIARRFHLEIPPQLTLLLKTLVHVEGLGRDLYPQLDIWKLAKPIVQDWVNQQLNPLNQLRKVGRQLPNMLLNRSELSLGWSDRFQQTQRIGQDEQVRAIHQLGRQLQKQHRRTWLFGGALLICLAIAFIVPWYIAIGFILLAVLLLLWRLLY